MQPLIFRFSGGNTDGRSPVWTGLVGGTAFLSGIAAVAVPKGEGPAALLEDIMLPVMRACSAALFFHNGIPSFIHL